MTIHIYKYTQTQAEKYSKCFPSLSGFIKTYLLLIPIQKMGLLD